MHTTLRLRAMFGLLDDPPGGILPSDRALRCAAADLDAALRPGRLALITGPSGAGKSTLARFLHERLAPGEGVRPSPFGLGASPGANPGANPDATPVDMLRGPLAQRLRTLASVGLGDAHLFTHPAHRLSAGERARLEIARAIDRLGPAGGACITPSRGANPGPTPTLILDELASTLDRPGAFRLARLLRRWLARHPDTRIVCLTAHEDLGPHLDPDLEVRIGRREGAPARVTITERDPDRPARPLAPPVLIEPGTRGDYDALAPLHYRAGAPAVIAGPRAILRALDPADGALAGVLVIAMPTLNARWRDVIWPGRYRTGDKRADAARLQADLRCIARVIVHPDYRALGVGVALVRHYLAQPLTPATEAIAAMGAATPIFERAGMRAYALPPTARDARLRDALTLLGLSPASMLAAPESPLLRRELRRWGAASRATRRLLPDLDAIARRAAGALLAPPIVYAHVAPAALPCSRDPETRHAPPQPAPSCRAA